MNSIDIDNILNRTQLKKYIADSINKNNIIYISGDYGCGKTHLIKSILNNMGHNQIYYDNTYNRNKQFIIDILKNNYNNLNVYNMFYKINSNNIIILDDIDTINKSDKIAFNTLITTLKTNYKTTKKSNNNNTSIILINNLSIDKKVTELIKLCDVIELKKPSNDEIIEILTQVCPNIFNNIILNTPQIISEFKKNLLIYINNNFNKLKLVIDYYNHDILYTKFINKDIDKHVFIFNQKKIVQMIMSEYYNINILNETNKTIVSLIFHENIVSLLNKLDHKNFIIIYSKIISNFTFSDYIDRNIFQKQLWQLNDINFYIKILYNNFLLYKYNLLNYIDYDDIDFTKILTKYSNEYNNYIFLNTLYKKLLISKDEMYTLFYKDKEKNTLDNIINYYNIYNINKTDILRLYRFIEYP